MQRYNLFNIIHKGLRAALYQTAAQLQQTDYSNAQESEAAVNAVNEVLLIFEGHAHKEDTYVFPHINMYEPSVAATFEAEHETDHQLGEKLKMCINTVLDAADADKPLAGQNMGKAFVSFLVFNLQHMAKEEEIINKILWQYYTDEEIKSISSAILKNTPPWIQDFYANWILRGINNREAVEWMRAIQRTAPEVVFKTLMAKAEKELSKDRLRKVTGALTDGVLVA